MGAYGSSGFWMMDWVDLSNWYLMVNPGGTWAVHMLFRQRTASLATTKIETFKLRNKVHVRWYGFLTELYSAPEHVSTLRLGLVWTT